MGIGQRADRAANMTPAVIDAGRAAFEFGRVHADRCRHHADTDRFAALLPNITIAKGLHWRHRIGLALRPPNFLSLPIPGPANPRCNFFLYWPDVPIPDRPAHARTQF